MAEVRLVTIRSIYFLFTEFPAHYIVDPAKPDIGFYTVVDEIGYRKKKAAAAAITANALAVSFSVFKMTNQQIQHRGAPIVQFERTEVIRIP